MFGDITSPEVSSVGIYGEVSVCVPDPLTFLKKDFHRIKDV